MTGRTIRLIGSLILALLLVSLLFNTSSSAAPSKVSSGMVVVVAGDSIARGVGASEERSMPSVLARQTHAEVSNVGHGGSCLVVAICPGDTLLDTIDAEVFSQNPDMVLLNIGINDLCHVSDYRLKESYRELGRRADANDVEIVFGTLPPYGKDWAWPCEDQRLRINEWMRSSRLNIVDFSAALANQKNMLRWSFDSGDGLHPNARGYRAMVRQLRFHSSI